VAIDERKKKLWWGEGRRKGEGEEVGKKKEERIEKKRYVIHSNRHTR
jgi:hypothetical protein